MSVKAKNGGNEGFVLVMVMLVLMATIIVGIFLSRTSFIETKIASNEAIYKQNIFLAESALEWAALNNSAAIGNLGSTINNQFTFSADALPSEINDVQITYTLTSIGKPKVRSGTDPSRFRTRYYNISATRQGHTLVMGVHKSFPKR